MRRPDGPGLFLAAAREQKDKFLAQFGFAEAAKLDLVGGWRAHQPPPSGSRRSKRASVSGGRVGAALGIIDLTCPEPAVWITRR